MLERTFDHVLSVFQYSSYTLKRCVSTPPPPQFLLTLMQQALKGHNPGNSIFWWCSTGHTLARLLAQSSCSPRRQREFLSFYAEIILPLLGPSPQEFRRLGLQPKSWLSDDHTPVEFIWVMDGEDARPSIRFAMEPLSPHDGTSLPPDAWRKTLNAMAKLNCMKSYDSQWADICYDTLIHIPDKKQQKQHASQFFLGGDFTPEGLVGKFYYIPKLRAQSEGCSEENIVSRCISQLGSMQEPWEMVTSYMATLPNEIRPTIEMVAVDTVDPSKNRIKIYYRSHVDTLQAITKLLTLNGKLDDEETRQNISIMSNLWGFLFPGSDLNAPLPAQDPTRSWPGFLFYYELTQRSKLPFPKVYIPVRQYCQNDAQIADAVSKYLQSCNNMAGNRYATEFKRLMNHRNAEARTGTHTYIACCGRPSGPQLSMYLSPEVFAPEREENRMCKLDNKNNNNKNPAS